MKERDLKAFNAIVEFVRDLCEVFEAKKVTPLNLYRRLTDHIRFTDEKAIQRVIRPFEEFVRRHKNLILSGELAKLPRGASIHYEKSPKAYIEIEKFVYRGDPSTKQTIQLHLLTISNILEPNEQALKELEKLQESSLVNSPEGKMVSGIVEKLSDMNIDESDIENPIAMVGQLMSSGVVTELFGNMRQGLASGDMDLGKLVGSLQTTMTALTKGSLDQSASSSSPALERPRLTSPQIEEVLKPSEKPALSAPDMGPELD